MRVSQFARTGALLFISLFLLAPARGQGAPPGPIHLAPGAHPEPTPSPEQRQHAIRARVSEVSAPVVVRDPRTEEMILDLAEKDFHVFDNGTEQKINHFDLGGEPLSIVLVVETSSHVEPMLPAIRKAGIVFTQTVMGKTAEAAVLGYDDKVDVLEPFTMEPDEIQNAINHLQAGYSGMRLYDAMARGIGMLEDRPSMRRRILMVIGEAQDSGSENKLGGVLRRAQLANVTIYSIGLSTTAADLRQPAGQYQPTEIGPPGTYPVPTPNGKPPTPEMEQAVQPNMDLGALLIWLVKTGKNALGQNSLEIASKATGGLHVNTLHDRNIQKAIDEIGGELHAEYTIGYRPPGDEPSGYHDIKVTVDRRDVSVRTRPGYYIPPPEE
ncbi:MAG TPA: VWA domain-containing protein [Candidatus Acidoferrales bacterium]|nr:VWA domain-containing protein [Candidatus Acidoferrales bacterium]